MLNLIIPGYAGSGRSAVVPLGILKLVTESTATFPVPGDFRIKSSVVVISMTLSFTAMSSNLINPAPLALNSKSALDIVVLIVLSLISMSSTTKFPTYAVFHLRLAEPKLYLSVSVGIISLVIFDIKDIVSDISSPNVIFPPIVTLPVTFRLPSISVSALICTFSAASIIISPTVFSIVLLETVKFSNIILPVPFVFNSKSELEVVVVIVLSLTRISPSCAEFEYTTFHVFSAEPKLYVPVSAGMISLSTLAINDIKSEV